MEQHTHALRHGKTYACTEAWNTHTQVLRPGKVKDTQVLRPGTMHTQALRPGTKGQPLDCFLHVVLWSMVHGNADQPKLSIIVLAHETLGPVQISLQIAISHTIRSMPCEYLTTDRLRWTKRHPFDDLAGDQHLLTSCALSTVQFACCTMFALY